MPDVNRSAPSKTHVQSVFFYKPDWTVDSAKTWLKNHGYYLDGMEDTTNTYRFRQYDPEESKFRYRNRTESSDGKKLVFVDGFVKEEKGAVPHSSFPKAPEDTTWDGGGAKQRLAQWASSDGSGDKEKMDWTKYRRAFLWYDSSKPEEFGSYKFPVVDVIGGTAKVVWNGVRAAYASLKGARGGTTVPQSDQSAMLGRIKTLYSEFGKDFEKEEEAVKWPLDLAAEVAGDE